MAFKKFLKDFASGGAIGVAMIIPGVSGGTIAVLLNIYEELIAAVTDVRKRFKESFALIFSVLLGAAVAFAAVIIPLKIALQRAPLPTVMLFAGLMLGSIPKLMKECKSFGFEKRNTGAILLPFATIIAICILKLFISAGDANLSASMPIWGYFAVFGVAMLASCALVIPGVSGSMLLMILGYYTPLLGLIGAITADFGHSALVLALFGAGLIIGFFSIAKLMKYFLDKFPHQTRLAITGFVLGSIPAIFIVFDYSGAPINGLQIAAGVVLCALGAVLSYTLTAFADGKSKCKNAHTSIV